MMQKLWILGLLGVAMALAGCGSKEPDAAAPGSTATAQTGGKNAGPKGMSANDLQVPGGAGDDNRAGSKLNGR